MNVITAYSEKTSYEECVKEIKEQFGTMTPKLILFFASSSINPYFISDEIQNAFPNTPTFGCTTAGEIVSGKMLKNSLVAIGLSENVIEDFKAAVITNLPKATSKNYQEAGNIFEKHFGEKFSEMDLKKYVGIVLADGLSKSEEKMMEEIGMLSNVLFIGGSAGDDLKFENTYLYGVGKAYTNATILILLKPAAGFDIIKTQSFQETGKILTATSVDEKNRTVIDFDGKPAVEAYAEALGTSEETTSQLFMTNPLGLMVDDEPYVRSPQQIKDKNMVFYCNIKEGMELSILESGDIIHDTRKALDDKVNEMGGIAALINFNCILRTLELDNKNLSGEYGQIFSDIPTIGFSTYGEQYIGHINQTATILAFKAKQD